MITDLDSYLSEIVDPAIAEFKDWQWSRRRGFVACVCLLHVVDYFPRPPKAGKHRIDLCAASPDFAAVDRVAHAFKHESTGHEHGRIKPLRSKHVHERPPAMCGQAAPGASIVGDGTGGVVVGGEVDDLFLIVRRAREFVEGRRAAIQG